MKVLLINGSPDIHGCTDAALAEVRRVLESEGLSCELLWLGNGPVRDCIGCGRCSALPKRCVFDDDIVNTLLEKAEAADGFVFGTPVYYSHPSGRILSVLDRVFYAGGALFARKPGMAVASARRAGTTASLDVLNKYFTIAQMPVVSSSYWNVIHGEIAAETAQDAEGLQTMRNGARNLAWLLRCIEAGRIGGIPEPETERGNRTNFIR